LTGQTTIYHVQTCGGATATVRFCSEDCSRAYRAFVNDYLEEFEEIDRAGAT